MQSKIVLISDDSNFFEYIIPKLSLRKSDELFRFKFHELPDKLHLLNSSLLIVNSEGNQSQTLELLSIIKKIPVIVFGFNDDEKFKIEGFKNGMFAYFNALTSDEEFNAMLLPALKLSSTLEKYDTYREMLVKNNIITKNNDVFLDFTNVLDKELEKIHKNATTATLVALSPDDKSKFLIQPNQIETAILNNIRDNDILMNYSPNKYLLLLNNVDLAKSKEIWSKFEKLFNGNVYAGFAEIGKKSRQQVMNEVLNNLHDSINKNNTVNITSNIFSGTNFKFYRQEFNKKIEQIITPVFYQIQQFYNDKLFGMKIEQGHGEGYGVLYITSRHNKGTFRITSPGFSSINIDITIEQIDGNNEGEKTDSKRIVLEPEELEEGLLQDLLEQFILEFKDTNQ